MGNVVIDRADKIRGWMDPDELLWFYQVSAAMDSIVELGCFCGRSTYVLCSGCPGKVYALDCHWCGTMFPFNGAPQYTMPEFMQNVGHFPNVVPLEGQFADLAASDLIPPLVDMVIVDGCHEKEAVLADFNTWEPRAKKMICGHDLDPSTPGVEKALAEFFGMDKVIRGPGKIWYIQKEK